MRRNLALFALLIVAALLPGPARADWMRDYDRGLKAIEQGNWAEAEASFRAAMRERDKPVAKQRFQGQRFEAYVPQHWAAYAAWKRGECSSAVEYWQTPGLEAALRGDLLAGAAERIADRQRGLADCSQRLAQSSAPAATPPAASTAAPPASAASSTTASTTTASTTTPGSTASTAARPGGAAPPTAAPSGTATQPGASTAPPAATTPPASRPATPPSPPREPVARASALDPAVGKAVDAYLAGRYAELDTIALPPASAAASRAQVLLLRAAGRFIADELDGGEATALEAVRRDIRDARAAQTALSPDAAMFPPRFRSLWQQTR